MLAFGAYGTAFSANGEVAAADFRCIAGREIVSEFAPSSERRRCFCSRCGSQLIIRRLDDTSTIVLTLGSLDSDPGVRPARHVFVDSNAPWYAITDELPRFRIYPGFEPSDRGE
jgi:hypothetical protein